jgi:hypothetical protein
MGASANTSKVQSSQADPPVTSGRAALCEKRCNRLETCLSYAWKLAEMRTSDLQLAEMRRSAYDLRLETCGNAYVITK